MAMVSKDNGAGKATPSSHVFQNIVHGKYFHFKKCVQIYLVSTRNNRNCNVARKHMDV